VFKIDLILNSINFVCFNILTEAFQECNSITTIIYPLVNKVATRAEKTPLRTAPPLKIRGGWACPADAGGGVIMLFI